MQNAECRIKVNFSKAKLSIIQYSSFKKPHLKGKFICMNKFRQGRVNEAARETLSDILRTVKDPRVSSAFVTITSVNVSRDMKFAKVYFSTIGGTPKEVKTGLYSAQGYMRRELALRLNLRITPELDFEYDDSAEKGARIESVLKSLGMSDEKEEKNED